jgi:hypothetical protein
MAVRCRFLVDTVMISPLIFINISLSVRNITHNNYDLLLNFFPPVPPHVHTDFGDPSPPGCGRSVTDVWGWGVHRAHLRLPDDLSDILVYERGLPGRTLNLNSTSYPDHGRCGELPLQWKIPTAYSGIEPVTSWLVVRSHEAGRFLIYKTAKFHLTWTGIVKHP